MSPYKQTKPEEKDLAVSSDSAAVRDASFFLAPGGGAPAAPRGVSRPPEAPSSLCRAEEAQKTFREIL